MELKKPVFYLVIRKQLSTSDAVLLRKWLSEDIDNHNNTEIFRLSVALKNFEGVRHPHTPGCDGPACLQAILSHKEAMPLDCAIIQEIYDNGNAQEQFEFDLDQALEAQRGIIIIEPAKLGDETARWITVGNCLHKTAVLAGVSCLATPVLIQNDVANFISIPMGTLSIICASIYGVSWQFDPCCKYQVEYDSNFLSKLPMQLVATSSPVVLVRKDDRYRKALHNLIAGLTALYMGHKFYHWIYQ